MPLPFWEITEMKTAAVALAVAVLLVCHAHPQPATADGLIYQLPKQGVWARYDMVFATERDGQESIVKGSLTTNALGQAKVNDKACRWIEFVFEVKQGDAARKTVWKALVPEEQLKRGGRPLQHVVKCWLKREEEIGRAHV